MSCTIHPTAIIEDGASLGMGVSIGAFAFIGRHVCLGDGVIIDPGAVVTGQTILESHVHIHSGATLGGPPQIAGHKDSDSGQLEIGTRTVIREQVTVNTGTIGHSGLTRIGADCVIMTGAHIAHDCQIGRKCMIANSTQLGGHVIAGDSVWFGGLVAVHQRCRIGDHAFIGGGSILVGDVIPYAIALGNHAALAGLNVIGLKRNGFAAKTIHTLRTAYKMLYGGDGTFAQRLAATRNALHNVPEVMNIITFITDDRKRPLCLPR